MPNEIVIERLEDDAIGLITLNRPGRHNALTLDMWRQIAASVLELSEEQSIRVIVIRGAGERAFASGADLHELSTHRQTAEGAAAYHMAVEAAFAALGAVEQPVIAMIHGYCIGGGCELAVACDLRIADERARFGIPAGKLGIVLGVDELRRLSNLVGVAGAKDILFTGRLLNAFEALRAGLVNQVVPAADLEETMMALARQIIANSSTAIAATKSLLDAIGSETPADELAAMQREFVDRAGRTTDSHERISAFVNRRERSADSGNNS